MTIMRIRETLLSNEGEHIWCYSEGDAHAERRMYIENGHAVSLVAGQTVNGVDGYSFDVYNLWTEREAWGLDDPHADELLHRDEIPSSDLCPIHGAGCEAWS